MKEFVSWLNVYWVELQGSEFQHRSTQAIKKADAFTSAYILSKSEDELFFHLHYKFILFVRVT